MDMPRERGADGQYTETAGGDDVLGVFDAVRGPIVTSADVAEELGVTRETARRKLNGLVDERRVEKRKTAGRVVYWRAGEAAEATPQHTADADERREADENGATEFGRLPDVGGLSFDRELTDERRDVLEAFLRWVKNQGDPVTRGDAEAGFWSEEYHDRAGYGFGSFWEAFGKAALKQVDSVEKPHARAYRWVGGDE